MDHKRRKAETRANIKPKSVHAVLEKLGVAQFEVPAKPVESFTMKAKCKRYANRVMLVGGTPFVFDKDGICVVDSRYRSSVAADFAQLVKMNGVEDITEREPAIVPAAPEPKTEPAPEVVLEPVMETTPEPEEEVLAWLIPEEPVDEAVEAVEESEEKPKKRRRRAKKETE